MKKIYFLIMGLFLLSSFPLFANTFSVAGITADDNSKKATTIVLKGRFIKHPERSMPLASPVDAVFVEDEGIYLTSSCPLSEVTVSILKGGCVIHESLVELPDDFEVFVPAVCTAPGSYVLRLTTPQGIFLEGEFSL
ncbi:hypothetical protein [Bacteroides sp.]